MCPSPCDVRARRCVRAGSRTSPLALAVWPLVAVPWRGLAGRPSRARVCVCVCVCVFARARCMCVVCLCLCVRALPSTSASKSHHCEGEQVVEAEVVCVCVCVSKSHHGEGEQVVEAEVVPDLRGQQGSAGATGRRREADTEDVCVQSRGLSW